MARIERWDATTVLVVGDAGPGIDGRGFRDLVGEALSVGAGLVVVPVGRLDPAFWDLSTGVAGDILQVSVVYELRLAVVGELPEPAASSRAFAALVRESNAGSQHLFMRSPEALRERLVG